MKLYKRQLHSLEELRRERHVLKYAVKHTDDWLNLKETGDDEFPGLGGAGILGNIISAITSKSTFGTILTFAPTLLNLFSKNKKGEKKKNPAASLIKEIAFGYIKWKAIQLAFRAIKNVASTKDHK